MVVKLSFLDFFQALPLAMLPPALDACTHAARLTLLRVNRPLFVQTLAW